MRIHSCFTLYFNLFLQAPERERKKEKYYNLSFLCKIHNFRVPQIWGSYILPHLKKSRCPHLDMKSGKEDVRWSSLSHDADCVGWGLHFLVHSPELGVGSISGIFRPGGSVEYWSSRRDASNEPMALQFWDCQLTGSSHLLSCMYMHDSCMRVHVSCMLCHSAPGY